MIASSPNVPADQEPTVSVIVVTAGRLQVLKRCLESMAHQNYPKIELVLVVGPSTDGTQEYVEKLAGAKVEFIDRLNVAAARNTGVRRSAGDIIVFIDDDAIAGPNWITDLVEAFNEAGPLCGGVGGYVINANDPDKLIQARSPTIDDLGIPNAFRIMDAEANDQNGNYFNFFMGANMAFRREAILAAGGCDDTYTYNYEDADLCVSVIKAGYSIVHHRQAVVHHFPAVSHNRKSEFDLNYFAINRHQTYFAFKHSTRGTTQIVRGLIRHKLDWLRFLYHERKKVGLTQIPLYAWRACRGIIAGCRLGINYRKHGRVPALDPSIPRSPFLSWPREESSAKPSAGVRASRSKRLHIAILCGEFGGRVFGGIGRYTENLAESLTSLGHHITIFRADWNVCKKSAGDYDIVDVPPSFDPAQYRVLVAEQLRQKSRERRIDLVEAPLWHGEGLGVGITRRWPLVVRLETPYQLVHEISGNPLDHHTLEMVGAERMQLAYADGVIGISKAVAHTVESTYGVTLKAPGREFAVIPLGLPPAGTLPRKRVDISDGKGTKFLFVGRLEARKGILELGEAFRLVAEKNPEATLWIVGADNSQHDGHWARTGSNYPQSLRERWPEHVRNRVRFFGSLSDEEKNDLYARCDVLVAPSTYESFGLIFLEAMRVGKATIGTNVGGIPEIVQHDRTGLLVPPNNFKELAQAMNQLVCDPSKRQSLGRAGLLRFEECFDLYQMGRRSENFYRTVLEKWWCDRPTIPRQLTKGNREVSSV